MTSLATSTWGKGPLLVLCHGFTQTSRSWGLFGELLGASHRVLAVDLPGHGASADLDTDVVGAAHALLDTVGAEPFDLLGYSMGARVAITAALMQPQGLEALILISANPGIADDAERAARRAADDALADALERSGDVEAFLDSWLDQPLFAKLRPDDAQRASRSANGAHGLARSLRHMGTGTQQPAWGFLELIEVPTLLLAGSRDEKYAALAMSMSEELPVSTLAVAPDVGHACHLEAPETCAQVVEHWLAAAHEMAKPSAKSTPTKS
jgi:2-succinyl-6-hydroxy-2,4-cyclohexadiene-1-carboxylate synthase